MSKYEYSTEAGLFAAGNAPFIEEAAKLYSAHYGFWREKDGLFKVPVVLSPRRLREWFKDETRVATAFFQGQLVAYAIAEQHAVANVGKVTWVTQLVVHGEHRHSNVAKTLLHSLFGFSNDFCWGLVSANPYAVRALEKATRRRCSPSVVEDNKEVLLQFADKHVNYISIQTHLDFAAGKCQINTQFDLDHSAVGQMTANVTTDDVPWTLGPLSPEHEWLAFTFNVQPQLRMSQSELDEMLDADDQIAQAAYSRMTLDSDHKWTRHTAGEVEFISNTCNLKTRSRILDVGCGIGRHSHALATAGHDVLGVDFSEALVRRARQQLSTAKFEVGDFRTLDLGQQFDCIVCLYDVIGSFARRRDNLDMIQNIARHLAPGGRAVVSVLNMELTEAVALHRFSLKQEPNRLLDLLPSPTMQETGDIFNPEFFMIESDENVVYRKEQFRRDGKLDAELVVRDRRYTREEIKSLFQVAGLNIQRIRCVQSGKWDIPLQSTDPKAKEILLVCEKPLTGRHTGQSQIRTT